MSISHARKSGFALVIALSLMAFILVLLLSITTLVRVETRASEVASSTLEARQNALLSAYIAVGELQRALGSDNNAAERAVRPSKLGMKNWLFIGHPLAGQRTAIIYTIIQNCKNCGADPQAYLNDVLQRLPYMTNDPEGLHQLQPKIWVKNHAKS